MKPRVLFVLQNAWRRGWLPDKPWHQPSWERALWRSHTGKRLREFIPPEVDYCVVNSTSSVACSAAQRFPIDLRYVLSWITAYAPDLVVLLGKVAGELAGPLGTLVPVVKYPHPTWRLLSKERTTQIQAELLARARQAVLVTEASRER